MLTLRPSLDELRNICRTLLHLAPALDVDSYVNMIENGVEGAERLGWMFAHVAACVALIDGLHPDSDAFGILFPIIEKNGVASSQARIALENVMLTLRARIQALYPLLDVDEILATLDEMPALDRNDEQ